MSSINVSKTVVKKTVVKKKLVIVNNPSVGLKVEDAAVPQNSIWMNVRRIPKNKPLSIVWENIEDISDDENDTPQAAGKRLSTLKSVRDQIRRRAYENQLIELQNAGLFLNWTLPLDSAYEENCEYPYAKNLEAYPYFHKF